MIETENLTKRFGQLTALENVSMSLESGQFHAIIGPNGAGKSTLFNVITGLLKPTSGRVLFQGEDITGLSPNKINRRGISRSFQIEDIFDGLSVAQNIQIAAQAYDERRRSILTHADSIDSVTEKVRSVLEDLGLGEKANHRAGNLSYGNRRKVEIGLAIASNPDLLLLDEPTAGMSRGEVNETVSLIERLSREHEFTIVWIEHDLELVMETADQIVVLDQGNIIAHGTPAMIQENQAVQKAYIGEEL